MRELIVVGSAPVLFEDYRRASEMFPLAEVMLVNGACAALPFADHVLAGHTDKAEQFQAARKKAFPDAPPWRLHANWYLKLGEKYGPPKKKFPSVTDWWGHEMSSGATSAGKAALIGLALGFDKIILAGCPMDGSGYFPGECEGIKKEAACQRIGDPTKQGMRTIRRYRERMAELAAGQFKGVVFSLSGFTREVLGAP